MVTSGWPAMIALRAARRSRRDLALRVEGYATMVLARLTTGRARFERAVKEELPGELRFARPIGPPGRLLGASAADNRWRAGKRSANHAHNQRNHGRAVAAAKRLCARSGLWQRGSLVLSIRSMRGPFGCRHISVLGRRGMQCVQQAA